jgi:tRNA1Val (adenine37-N6)-methyltransferase
LSELTSLGPLLFMQSKKGYRHNIDSVILANFVSMNLKGEEHILDVGSGDGVISVILKKYFPEAKITGIEIQQNLYNLSIQNSIQNNLEIKFYNNDFFEHKFNRNSFQIILSNPPYYPLQSGRICKSEEKTVAKHEITFSLDKFLKKSKNLLTHNGSIFFIYPSTRFLFAFNSIYENKLFIKNMRFVHNTVNENSVLVLFRLSKQRHKCCVIDSPLVIYEDKCKKIYTEELKKYLFYN